MVIPEERCPFRGSWTQRPDFRRFTDVLEQTKLELLIEAVTDMQASVQVHPGTTYSLSQVFTGNSKNQLVNPVGGPTGIKWQLLKEKKDQDCVKFSKLSVSKKLKFLKCLKILKFNC